MLSSSLCFALNNRCGFCCRIKVSAAMLSMPCCLCWSWANGSSLNIPSRPASAMTHISATSCGSGSFVLGSCRNSFTSSPKLTLEEWTIWAAIVDDGEAAFEYPFGMGGGAIPWVELPPLRAMVDVTDVASRLGSRRRKKLAVSQATGYWCLSVINTEQMPTHA